MWWEWFRAVRATWVVPSGCPVPLFFELTRAPQPHPLLATSGLDDDVKIWQPGPEFDEVENVKQKEYMRETISK